MDELTVASAENTGIIIVHFHPIRTFKYKIVRADRVATKAQARYAT